MKRREERRERRGKRRPRSRPQWEKKKEPHSVADPVWRDVE
jgi:hypothetical protein